MGNTGITLSKSDPAGLTMLGEFRSLGFTETDRQDVLRMDDVYLFVIEPLILHEERYKNPTEPDPLRSTGRALRHRLLRRRLPALLPAR